jgi:hypothetical protein
MVMYFAHAGTTVQPQLRAKVDFRRGQADFHRKLRRLGM